MELRQQLILEKATAVRLHAEIEEKDARITMMQIRLSTFDSASSDSVATASNRQLSPPLPGSRLRHRNSFPTHPLPIILIFE